jgi:hypothetical protein
MKKGPLNLIMSGTNVGRSIVTDVVERLKAYAECSDITGAYTEAKCVYDAIDEIERLRAENEKLKERITELGWISSPERMGQ